MRMNRKKQRGKHAVISCIRMPQLRCTRVSESGILRRVALALCACLLFTAVFVGCGTEASDEPVDPNKLQVICRNFISGAVVNLCVVCFGILWIGARL